MRRTLCTATVRARRALAGLLGAVAMIAFAPPGGAQERGVSRFSIESSDLELRGDVRPHQYVGVMGRRSAWLGSEAGAAELWVHPLKVVNDLELAFTIPDYADPIRGSDVARTVIVRPELTTIVYSHARFTVKQHILAPLDAPGLLVLLDVQSPGPLEVVVEFQAALQYAWPAAFGGQYAFWDEEALAFVLSESLSERNAYVGSPWATSASSHPAHSAPEAPSVFRIRVDPERAAREFIPIALAAGTAPREEILDEYRALIRDAERHYRDRVEHTRALLASAVSVDTPDDELDRALRWSAVNLDEQMACSPDVGCGLVAGWGPSGKGARPGFGWFFGGDAAINSLAMSVLGLEEGVAQGLRFLAGYQRADGKIPHEISQAAGQIPWFDAFPYAYYHADTTPYWIVAVWRYWLSTSDTDFVEEMWPSVERAFQWGLGRDTDGDGIIENGPGNLGAIEVGALGENIHQDIYLAAVWLEALGAVADLAGARNDRALADQARAMRERGLATLNERYWRADAGHHAFGILATGETNDNLTVWPATALAFELLEPERADQTLRKLAQDSVTSDWGAHILSRSSPLYDPMHYNNGAVWPFVTGFLAWAQYNYGRPWNGYPLVDALKQMMFDFSRGRHPELLSGTFYRPLDAAVPQQFFATSMLVSPALRGMIGWRPDAPRGAARLAPLVPPTWDTTAVRGLAVGSSRVDAVITNEPGRRSIRVLGSGDRVEVRVDLPLPPGAEARALTVDGAPVADPLVDGVRGSLGVVVQVGSTPTTVALTWNGGLDVAPPLTVLEPGQPSGGLRILDFGWVGTHWELTVEGRSGQAYSIDLIGAPAQSLEGAAVEAASAGRTRIRVELPAGAPRTIGRVRIIP